MLGHHTTASERLHYTNGRALLCRGGGGRWVKVGRLVEAGGGVHPQGGGIAMATRGKGLTRVRVHCLLYGGHCMECRGSLQGGGLVGMLVGRREGGRPRVRGNVVVQFSWEWWGLVWDGRVMQC